MPPVGLVTTILASTTEDRPATIIEKVEKITRGPDWKRHLCAVVALDVGMP